MKSGPDTCLRGRAVLVLAARGVKQERVGIWIVLAQTLRVARLALASAIVRFREHEAPRRFLVRTSSRTGLEGGARDLPRSPRGVR